MNNEEEKLCWFGKFDLPRCPETARWHLPTSENSFVQACKWCDKHKHDNDILIKEVEEIRKEE